jgi:tetrahydromethanopterin S-methyltransferase subunit D
MDATPLEPSESATYFTLRWGTALLGLALPLVLWIGGLLGGQPLQGSISAYYYTGMRDEFVGVLAAVGALLVVYRGYTRLEDVALDLAGAFLVGVALVPMGQGSGLSLHGAFAVLFFLCIAYVCLFRAGDTLELVSDPALRRRYRAIYRAVGALLVASPLAAIGLSFLLLPSAPWKSVVFLAEAAGVWVFAAYWIAKSAEVRGTGSEVLAMAGRLSTRRYGLADAFRPIAVLPTPTPPQAAAPGRALRGDRVPVRL